MEKQEHLLTKLYRSAPIKFQVEVQISPGVPWLLAIMLLAALGCGRTSHERTESSSLRVVTMTPTSTELVAALGAADLIVGVDEHSEEPERVRSLPKVGSFLQLNLEAVLILHPDLVVMDRVQEKIAPKLRAAGIEVVVLAMHTLSDLQYGLSELGRALGREERATMGANAIEDAINAARARAANRSDARPEVLAVVDRAPGRLRKVYVAGPGSYIDELLAVIGAGNVMAGSGVRYASISTEQILLADPTVILDGGHAEPNSDRLADWSAVGRVRAVANGRVYAVPGRLFTSPNTHVAAALEQLERLIYGISAE